ncbi:kelch-like protein 23 [Diaphorina citri]|jgi:BTB/POZ domain.|nr:kelch-like protein 23 [Diaphorina citri]
MFHSRCLEAKQNNIQMKGIDVEMMTLLLEYCYSSRITITRNNCQALLSAANLLQILPVKAAACTFLQQHMDASNCLGIHCFAEQHACTELQNEAKDFVLA